MKQITVAPNMIYSETLDDMIFKGFYMKKKNGEYRHYTWNEEDCLYYADETDELWYDEVPSNAVFKIK